MKYEMIFGDESLFDGAPEDVDMIGYSGGFYKNSPDGPMYCCGCTFTTDEYRNKGFIAMRRIIKEPKRWTWEDKKAGRLPEVGALVVGNTTKCKYEISKATPTHIVLICVDEYAPAVGCYTHEEFFSCHNPIETPAEKAQRLREEWCIKALSSCSILSGMQNYELKRLGGYIKDIYDALLSGELQVPKGE